MDESVWIGENASLSGRRIRKAFRPRARAVNLAVSAVGIRMKATLDHLPPDKRSELAHVVAVLEDEFKIALAAAGAHWVRKGKLLKIILFGSFARGGWVDEPENGYQSDWDLLVIVNDDDLTVIEDFWWEPEEKLLHDPEVRRTVNIIVHTLAQVNQALKKGEYFWVDIINDGVMVLERSKRQLATPQPLVPADAYAMAKKYFEKQIPAAADWIEYADDARAKISKGGTWANKAAFSLHQAVETAYGCLLLVRMLYRPYSHNIKFLRSLSEGLDKRLIPAWPRETKKDRSRFELLKKAYVDARYSEHYKIQAEDLDLLADCARELGRRVDEVCREWLEKLRANANL
jgi:uncharacterized protein